jgi:hypothetical protein
MAFRVRSQDGTSERVQILLSARIIVDEQPSSLGCDETDHVGTSVGEAVQDRADRRCGVLVEVRTITEVRKSIGGNNHVGILGHAGRTSGQKQLGDERAD